MKIYIILYILIIKYYYERKLYNCNNFLGELILLAHNILTGYIIFGQFYFSIKYHLIFILLVIIHWITNNNNCFISKLNFDICN